jgi:hypothetical protein
MEASTSVPSAPAEQLIPPFPDIESESVPHTKAEEDATTPSSHAEEASLKNNYLGFKPAFAN